MERLTVTKGTFMLFDVLSDGRLGKGGFPQFLDVGDKFNGLH